MEVYYVEYLCYDDGCHLKKFAENPVRRHLTPTSQKIAEMCILVDKMHVRGHVDKWCLENCDARKISELDDVSLLIYKPCMYLTHTTPCR